MNAKHIAAISLALALAACASTPRPDAAMDDARAAIGAADANPNVSQYAALELETAKKDMAAADAALQAHNNDAAAQSAYLAMQNARVAQAHAAAKADDARVAAGQAERDKIMLTAREREATNAKSDAARLQAEVDDLKAKSTNRGLVMTLGDVLFDTGKAELNAGAARKLDQLAQFLTEHTDRKVQIDGFTDSVGADAYNEELSRRRADAVKSALMSRGVDASRIGTQGYGKAYPVASNNDSGGRQLNRRVEVVIGGQNGTPIAPRSAGTGS